MDRIRAARTVLQSRPVIEGAGVHLKRAFGFGEVPLFDPFLLLDDFRSREPERYRRGFPWHPHRGIETVTYVLRGDVAHGDSLGNAGDISSGDVQWMTAGSGIIHQEMPRGDADGVMEGFQLWANLPAARKMMTPRYRDVKAGQIPVVPADGAEIRVICGEVDGVGGPVRDIVTEPVYLDVTLAPGARYVLPAPGGHTALAYAIDGSGRTGNDSAPATLKNETLVLYGTGDDVAWQASAEGLRLLFFSGRPLGEPVAWRGPIVMNTQEELRQAFRDVEDGRFVREGR